MKMDRELNTDGCGKYAIINLRRLNEVAAGSGTFQRWSPAVEQALKTLEEVGALEWGAVGTPDEFFVVKLKDQHAQAALLAYADDARASDPEFATSVAEMAQRAGPSHPLCRNPD